MNSAAISIIIPTMNRIHSLKDTFEYLKESTVVPDEIIIVDQSTKVNVRENIKAWVQTLPFNIRYFYRSPSLTAARNFGIREARNDIVVFMDDDVRVQPVTIENVMKRMADMCLQKNPFKIERSGISREQYLVAIL